MAMNKREKTPEQALRSLMNLCVKAERSEFDVRRLLERWGVAEGERQRIVDTLVRERFVDNRRYAEAYVREKVRFSGWGRYKIRAALRAKRIDESIVEGALEQVDGASMREKLEHRLQMKMNRTKSRDAYDLRGKLVRYGAGLGFDTDTVLEVVERLMKERGEITEN
ncbi:MAG TPA: RecX family transcriptional regulator [Candidatus Alistipes pullicola]|nr:RecX family transcriptional regulator [Candidatus Alistipes pullicola]